MISCQDASSILRTAKLKCQAGLWVIKNTDHIFFTLNPSNQLQGWCSFKMLDSGHDDR